MAQRHDERYIDSAVARLPMLREDTNKVKLLAGISSRYMYINGDSGIVYGRSALELSEKLGWKKGIVMADNYMGLSYLSKSDYEKALEWYFKGLKINEGVKDRHLQGVLTGNIGAAYHDLGLDTQALVYHLKTIEILKESNDERNIATVYGNIAMVYNTQCNYRMALDYDFRALKIDAAAKDSGAMCIVCGNIGNVYSSLKDDTKALEYYFKATAMAEKTKNKTILANVNNGIAALYEDEGKYEEALMYYYQSLKANEAVGDKSGIAIATGNIGNLLAGRGDHLRAIQLEGEALKIAEETGNREIIALELRFLGAAYLDLAIDTAKVQAKHIDLPEGIHIPPTAITGDKNERIRKATGYLERSLNIEEEIHHLEGMKLCYGELARAYQLTGNFKKAAKYLQNYVAINDSVFSKDKKEEMRRVAMEKEYDIALMKERMNAEAITRNDELMLRKQHEYLFLSISGIVILIGISLLVVRSNRVQHKLHAAIQKMTERELAQSESSLKSIFDNTEMMYLLLDINYDIVSYNQRMRDMYLEVTRHPIKAGENLTEMLLPEKKSQVVALYDGVVASKQSTVYETAYHTEHGTKYFMAQVTPISVNDVVNGLCISIADITKMKALEFEREKVIHDLKQKNNDLYQFSQIVSHNLRGPLSTIMALTRLVRTSYPDVDMDFVLRGLSTSSNRLDAVLKDLNQILMVRNKTEDQKEVVRLSDIVGEVKTELSGLIHEYNAQVNFDFAVINEINTVRSYLFGIFYHLIDNSVKYSKDGVAAEVWISSQRLEHTIIITVADNGLGIDLDLHKNKIFKIYQRFHNHIEGKGVGLFMVKTYVDSLKGEISVESKPGMGTTFEIVLPA